MGLPLHSVLSPKQQTTLIEALKQHVKGLRAVYLFGSRAGDPKHVTDTSDYDIAYDADFPKALTSKGKLELFTAVMDALGSDHVDLVDLRDSLGHVFRMSIIGGQRIWVRDMSETYEGEFIGEPAQDCDRDCNIESSISGYAKYNGNVLYAVHEGSDPCITPATDISLRSSLSTKVAVDGDSRETYSYIKGILANKGFPTHEYIRKDAFGNSVMLHTQAPEPEAKLVGALIYPIYETCYALDYQIEIDPLTGAFLSEIVTPELSSSTTFNQTSLLNPISVVVGANVCDLKVLAGGQSVSFACTTSTISNHNTALLSGDPALDCQSIPCPGIYAVCGN